MAALWEFVTSPIRRFSGVGLIASSSNGDNITKPAVLFNAASENDENAPISNVRQTKEISTQKAVSAPIVRQASLKKTNSVNKRPVVTSKLPSAKQPLGMNMKKPSTKLVKVKNERLRTSLRKKHKTG